MKAVYSIEEQKDMLWWLENRHEMPTKYMYFGIGSKRWIAIAHRRMTESAALGIHMLERVLITQKINTIIDSLSAYGYKNYNIIDFGCGDGSPTYPIFQYLRKNKPSAKLKYNPIDISVDMLATASKNVKGAFGVAGERNKWDLDIGNFSQITKKLNKPNFGNLYLFLGATIGNMPSIRQDLINFRESMQRDDYFLIGAELLKESDIGTIMKEFYNVGEVFDIEMTSFEYLGARRSHFAFRTIFNRAKSQIEGYIIPDRDIKIKLAGKEVILEKDQQIMSYRSVRFTTERLTGLLEKAGLRLEMFTTSRDNKYALSLTQPII
ncbi:MAG: L-histidine N(alpha)-methyltransferase [Candidatus Micrarchaeales archaeon]|nr:L-histidine N(alpha)-methyltransferase [Candidatus Micrarchaeales archaeon]